MSLLSYNGIILSFTKTDSMERRVRLSPDETEYMWTDFIITINTLFNPAATSYGPTGYQYGNLPMTTDTSIRSALLQPRKQLVYTEGGLTILNILPDQNGIVLDCENGPLPQYCNVTRIASSRLFYVSFQIKASIIECFPGATISPIASSRYSRLDNIDDNYISTMTTSGVTYFRSNILEQMQVSADFYRGYIIPLPLLGYKRTNISFKLDPNGIYAEWATTDVGQIQDLGDATAAPGSAAGVGITSMGLTYHVGQFQKSSLGIAGPGSQASVKCWAKCKRGAEPFPENIRIAVMDFLLATAYAKLAYVLNIGFLSSAELSEDIFENIISLSLSYIVIPDDNDNLLEFNAPVRGIVGTPILTWLPSYRGLNPMPPISQGTRGNPAYMLAVSAFATACYSNPFNLGIDDTGQIIPPDSYTPGTQSGQSPEVRGYYDPGPPNPQPSSQSKTQRQLNESRGSLGNKVVYTRGEIKENSIGHTGIIFIPAASNPNSNQDNQQSDPSGVNIQLFKPTAKKVVEWAFERVGAVPELPNPAVPYSQKNNYTLLTNFISPVGIELGPDAYTIVYRVSGVYTYSVLNPQNLSQGTGSIQFPIPPWVNVQPGDFTQLVFNDFKDGIINTSQGGNDQGPSPTPTPTPPPSPLPSSIPYA